MRLDDLTLYWIHPQNFRYIGFCFIDFDLETTPAAANDD